MKNAFLALTFLILMLESCETKTKQSSEKVALNKVADGVKQGAHIDYFPNGSFKSILFYVKDSLDGECIRYHENGKIRSKVNYINNKENGMAYYFYPSGVIESFREWKDGKKIGYGNDYYDTTGETKAAMLYNEEGFLILRKTFDIHGKLIKEEKAGG